MKVAIVGSRGFRNLDVVREYVRKLPPGTVVVSGGAAGVDTAAAEAAVECGLSVLIYHPDWKKYGRSAGPRRNRTIVETSDRVVAFYDGTSRGTASSIAIAKELARPLEVIS